MQAEVRPFRRRRCDTIAETDARVRSLDGIGLDTTGPEDVKSVNPRNGTDQGVSLPFSLDAIDRKIVSLLLEDGRVSSAEITRRIGHVSERAVRYRIERLIRSGVIRISAVVDPHAVGFSVIGDVLIDVAPGRLQDVAAQIVQFDNVSYVAGSVGEGDLSIQVYSRDTEELLRFVNEVVGKVPGVTRTKTAMVPWKLKDVYQWHVPAGAADEGRLTG
jgi:Lrp/AsnC family transcriptional regulator for asnA, asnC and gidA